MKDVKDVTLKFIKLWLPHTAREPKLTDEKVQHFTVCFKFRLAHLQKALKDCFIKNHKNLSSSGNRYKSVALQI